MIDFISCTWRSWPLTDVVHTYFHSFTYGLASIHVSTTPIFYGFICLSLICYCSPSLLPMEVHRPPFLLGAPPCSFLPRLPASHPNPGSRPNLAGFWPLVPHSCLPNGTVFISNCPISLTQLINRLCQCMWPHSQCEVMCANLLTPTPLMVCFPGWCSMNN